MKRGRVRVDEPPQEREARVHRRGGAGGVRRERAGEQRRKHVGLLGVRVRDELEGERVERGRQLDDRGRAGALRRDDGAQLLAQHRDHRGRKVVMLQHDVPDDFRG